MEAPKKRTNPKAPVILPCVDTWKLLKLVENVTDSPAANETPPQKNDAYKRYSCAGKGCNFPSCHIAPCETTVRINESMVTSLGPYLSKRIPGTNMSTLPVKYDVAIRPYWFSFIWNVDLISFVQAEIARAGPVEKDCKQPIANVIHLLDNFEV